MTKRSEKEPTIEEGAIPGDTSLPSDTEDYLSEKVDPATRVTAWLTQNEKHIGLSTTDTESLELSQTSGSVLSVFATIPEEEEVTNNDKDQNINNSNDGVTEEGGKGHNNRGT